MLAFSEFNVHLFTVRSYTLDLLGDLDDFGFFLPLLVYQSPKHLADVGGHFRALRDLFIEGQQAVIHFKRDGQDIVHTQFR